jgi:hypothetical protein
VQITPFWIESINEIELLLARAGLYLLLPRNGAGRVTSRFIVDELAHVVAVRKPGQQLYSMLMNTRFQVAGNPGVEHRVALVGQNVDAVDLFHSASGPSLRGAQRRSDLVGDEIASLRSQ